MCVWYSLRNVKCYIPHMVFDSSASTNHFAFRWKIFLDTFTEIHTWLFGLANELFNHSWWCRGTSVLKFGHQPPYYFVYTISEGSGKSTYTYAQAHLSLHCSTLRQVPKSNGFIPLICSFVTSISILFDLNYAKIIIGCNFVSTIMFTFDMQQNSTVRLMGLIDRIMQNK